MKTKQFQKFNLGILILTMMLGSCVNYNKVKLIQEKTIKDTSSEIYNQRSTAYKVNSGDYLYIKVNSTDPKTSKFFKSDLPEYVSPTYLYLNSFLVDHEGNISFSFIDKIYVKGLSLDEVRKKVQENLDLYFKETTVTVKLAQFQISILGEVGSPGTYTIDKEDITILQAISLAGGPQTFANINKVRLVRQTQNGNQIHILNLADNGIFESPYFYLMPNDVLYFEPKVTKAFITEKWPLASIMGTVLSVGLSVIAIIGL